MSKWFFNRSKKSDSKSLGDANSLQKSKEERNDKLSDPLDNMNLARISAGSSMEANVNLSSDESNFNHASRVIEKAIMVDEVDAKLESENGLAMRNLVESLNEESPSMAWRSQLSQRLAAESSKRKTSRKRTFWAGSSFGVSLAACAAVAGIIMIHRPTASLKVLPAADTSSFETALVKAHENATTIRDVTGVGLTASDLQSEESTGTNALDSENVDSL